MRTVIFFPDVMRETIITRWQIILFSLPAILRYCIIFFLCCGAIVMWQPVSEEGLTILGNVERWLPVLLEYLLWPAALFFLAVAFVLIRGVFGQKGVNIRTQYGFDEQGIYIHNALGSLMLTWASFGSVRETQSFFLFREFGQTILWPKAPWSPEELAEMRTLCKRARTKEKRNQP